MGFGQQTTTQPATPAQSSQTPIILTHIDGRQAQVSLTSDSKCSQLVSQAREKFGIPNNNNVLLLYGGRHIDGNKSLSEAGLIKNSRVMVTAVVPGGF